jgi:hypothetical protein
VSVSVVDRPAPSRQMRAGQAAKADHDHAHAHAHAHGQDPAQVIGMSAQSFVGA